MPAGPAEELQHAELHRHSALMPAALTIGHHFSISAFWNAPSACGVSWSTGGMSWPSAASFSLVAGLGQATSPRRRSAWRRRRPACPWAPTGRATPRHRGRAGPPRRRSASRAPTPGAPWRVTAKALIVPARSCGSTLEAWSIMMSIWPAKGRASPAPCRDRARTGSCVPVIFWKKMPRDVRRAPTPPVPAVALSGLAFSQAISAFRSLAGRSLRLTISAGR